MGQKIFGVVLNCIDGRVQIPVTNWMKKEFKVDYVDSITEPGMDAVLACGDKGIVEMIKNKAIIAINAHDAKIIAVVGHYDCAGNNASEEEHKEQIKLGVQLVNSWNLKIPTLGIWVDKNFQAHLVEV